MGTPGTSVAIEASALRRTFKGGIEAVRDVDLTVALCVVLTALSLRAIATYDR